MLTRIIFAEGFFNSSSVPEFPKEVNCVPPDLLVYPDDLNWRAIGTVGHETIYSDENDTGPDDANHDYNGILISNLNKNVWADFRVDSVLSTMAASVFATGI